jgi:hypothetical protein
MVPDSIYQVDQLRSAVLRKAGSLSRQRILRLRSFKIDCYLSNEIQTTTLEWFFKRNSRAHGL